MRCMEEEEEHHPLKLPSYVLVEGQQSRSTLAMRLKFDLTKTMSKVFQVVELQTKKPELLDIKYRGHLSRLHGMFTRRARALAAVPRLPP